MSDKLVQFEEAVFAGINEALPRPSQEALAALHLGIGLMMASGNPLVRHDFEAEQQLWWPRLQGTGDGFDASDLEGSAEERITSLELRRRTWEEGLREEQQILYKELHNEDQRRARIAGVAFCILGVSHPAPLVGVSAAISVLALCRRWHLRQRALARLLHALESTEDPLAERIAWAGWSRAPEFRSALPIADPLSGFLQGIAPRASGPQAETRTTILVHGTVFQKHAAPLEEWWRPADAAGNKQGEFHAYLEQGPRPNVYRHQDFYRWSGGWSDYARLEAAEKLVHWIDARGIESPDVFAHSHGCNVAMLASQARAMDRLVLMSCPVWPAYRPGNQVVKALSVRVKWDLVIMADGGAQRFPPDLGVTEHVLPLWFGLHEASRQGATWRKEKLDLQL